jgi:hypothetical protein
MDARCKNRFFGGFLGLPLFASILAFGSVEAAIVGSPSFNSNPIIEGNALIVSCTTNSGDPPNIQLQVNNFAASGFTASVTGMTVSFRMDQVQRSLNGASLRCFDMSDSMVSPDVTLMVYYPPEVSVSQPTFNVVAGGSVAIGYSITEGNPSNSNFTLFWNGNFVNPVQYDRNASYISFSNLPTNFRGNYVIRVSNVASSGQAGFVLDESGAEKSSTVSAMLLFAMMSILLLLLSG